MRSMHTSAERTYVSGTIVAVQVGPVKHKGLVSDRTMGGLPMVISNSKKLGCVAEEPWWQFAEGRLVEVRGYPGRLRPQDVLARARLRLGQPWTLSFNCEHFVNYAHGLDERSPTLRQAVAASLALFVLAMLSSK